MKLKQSGWIYKIVQWVHQELEWFRPGLGLKRWLTLMALGTLLLGLGIALIILDIYRNATAPVWVDLLAFLSLRFLPRWLRFMIFGGFGLSCIFLGSIGFRRTVLKPFVGDRLTAYKTVAQYRRRSKGPRVVVLGGGSGLASMLRGLKKHSSNITAIVTMADDGGSSGELRRMVGAPPPGDIRNCLAALSDDEALLTQIFQYRFGKEYNLNGHSLGNLFIMAMGEITGSFEEGVAEAGRVLAVTGRVLPATLQDVRLAAIKVNTETGEEKIVRGESDIPKVNGRIKRIWLEPDNPQAFPPAIQAILSADLIVVGPGSLHTSLLANLLVPDIGRAVKASKANKFYVCNITSEPGETDGFCVGDHIRVFESHLGQKIFDLLICNNAFPDHLLPKHLSWIRIDEGLEGHYTVYSANLVDKTRPTRHDSDHLAQVVMDLFYERTGPLLLREDEDMT
ncbi:MAG: YvcK family protein [Anaerolineae bacterium]|nr:YvcK family protein [Anaerolineae bacterium]